MEARNPPTGNTIKVHRKNITGEALEKQMKYIFQGARMIMLDKMAHEKLAEKDGEIKSGELVTERREI